MKKEKTKMQKCKFAMIDVTNTIANKKTQYFCRKKDTMGNPFNRKVDMNDEFFICSEEHCEQCELYKSKYIEYPTTINGIETKGFTECWERAKPEIGKLVEVRPCGKEYEDKTYLGIYLGNLPFSPMITLSNEKILNIDALTNPCIFIPETKSIVWGMESWWCEIENVDDIKDITNETIDNVWYVQLMKSLTSDQK